MAASRGNIHRYFLRAISCCVAFLACLVVCQANAITLKVDQVTLNSPTATGVPAQSIIVNFPIIFSTTPAVFVLPNDTNSDPMSYRIHTVTPSSFEIFVSEPEAEDAVVYPPISFSYLAIEPGTYTLGSGDVLEVGIATGVTDFQSALLGGDSYFTQSFSATAAARYGSTGTPVVVTEIQSLNSDSTLLTGAGSMFTRDTQPWLETVQASNSTTSVQFSLMRAETSAGTISGLGEDIAWLAIDDGADTTILSDSSTLIELKSAESIENITNSCTSVSFPSSFSTNNPIAFASMHSLNGNNGGWVRECGLSAASVSLFIQEDRANDTEVAHTTEMAKTVAFSEPFTISAGTPMVVATENIPGAASSSLNFTSVAFAEPMNARPIVFALATDEGADPAMVRVDNISANGFDIAQVQPLSGTGAAPSMTIDYLAVVPGNHVLPDGTRLLAGEVNTSAYQGSATGGGTSWDVIPFSPAFSATPSVLIGIQTFNSNPLFDPSNPAVPFLETAARNKTASGIELALDYVKTSAGVPPSEERIGYLAAESVESTIKVIGGPVLDIKILDSPTTIEGVSEGCDNIFYATPFTTSTPRVLATLNTRNGGDGGWLRRCSLAAGNVGLQVDEDQTGGSDRSHGADETAGIFAFEGSFDWEAPEFVHGKTVSVEWDPVNGFVNPKTVPGHWARYSLNVVNSGRIEADSGTVILEDTLPFDVLLFVGDLDSSGCPFVFVDGTDSSGLSLDCAAGIELLSTSPPCASVDDYCLLGDFSFADDWDSSDITDVRVTLDNAFIGSDGSSSPEFEIQYRVRLD